MSTFSSSIISVGFGCRYSEFTRLGDHKRLKLRSPKRVKLRVATAKTLLLYLTIYALPYGIERCFILKSPFQP